MEKSGTVTVSLAYKYDGKDLASAGHDVIMVADTDASGAVNTGDLAEINRVILKAVETPESHKNGGVDYVFELMDTDKSDIINTGDLAVINRMLLNAIAKN